MYKQCECPSLTMSITISCYMIPVRISPEWDTGTFLFCFDQNNLEHCVISPWALQSLHSLESTANVPPSISLHERGIIEDECGRQSCDISCCVLQFKRLKRERQRSTAVGFLCTGMLAKLHSKPLHINHGMSGQGGALDSLHTKQIPWFSSGEAEQEDDFTDKDWQVWCRDLHTNNRCFLPVHLQ